MPYCSPEQIRGEAIDQRSNLFTLGTILYEMVAGRKAFDATDPVALVGQIENEMLAPPESFNPKAHPLVCAAIMKALAKAPAERYQTARELVDDLEKCKDTSEKPTGQNRKRLSSPSAMRVDPARAARPLSSSSPRRLVRRKIRAARPAALRPARAIAASGTASAQAAKAGSGGVRTNFGAAPGSQPRGIRGSSVIGRPAD